MAKIKLPDKSAIYGAIEAEITRRHTSIARVASDMGLKPRSVRQQWYSRSLGWDRLFDIALHLGVAK